jgi:hypothetical protein
LNEKLQFCFRNWWSNKFSFNKVKCWVIFGRPSGPTNLLNKPKNSMEFFASFFQPNFNFPRPLTSLKNLQKNTRRTQKKSVFPHFIIFLK